MRALWLAVFLASGALGGARAAQGAKEASLPWRLGEAVVGSWVVSGVQRHPAYIRFALKNGSATASIEINLRGDGATAPGWRLTRRYRLQPAPGPQPDAAMPGILDAAAKKLRRFEAKGGYVPLLAEIGKEPAGAKSQARTAALEVGKEPAGAKPPARAAMSVIATVAFVLAAAAWLGFFELERSRRKGSKKLMGLAFFFSYIAGAACLGDVFPFNRYAMFSAPLPYPTAQYVFFADGAPCRLEDYGDFTGLDAGRLKPPDASIEPASDAVSVLRWLADHAAPPGLRPGPVTFTAAYRLHQRMTAEAAVEGVKVLAVGAARRRP